MPAPHPPPPQGQVNDPRPLKVWESVGQEAIPTWGQDVTYLSQMGPFPAPHVPMSPPFPVVPSASTFPKVKELISRPYLFLKTKAMSSTCWVKGRGIGRMQNVLTMPTSAYQADLNLTGQSL
jgi:hypothetical protein